MFPASRLLALPAVHDARASALRLWPRPRLLLALSGALLCAALVWAGDRWQAELTAATALGMTAPFGADQPAAAHAADLHPLVVLLKLAAAALIGVLVTAVQRSVPRERSLARSMEQAQTLLCVSGAMMMIIIGNSLARAFGIAGAAAIIRFRTPVDDPRDTTILFLLLALGMAAGIGALQLAGLGALCLCLLLPALDRFSDPAPRVMTVEIVARAGALPSDHVQDVFRRYEIACEPREITHGEPARAKYRASLSREASLDAISAELLAHDAVASLSWETSKKS